MFHCILTAFLGVVFTPPVGYSRPPSAVNDPTVTKQVNSGKSCLEEVSQLLILSGFPDQSVWVRLQGDFRMNKESTMFLASSTKTKKSFQGKQCLFEIRSVPNSYSCGIKWWVSSSSARSSIWRQRSSGRPLSIIFLRNLSSRTNRSWLPW